VQRWALAIATVISAGYAPFAPGTVGSLVGLALYAGLAWAGVSWSVTAAVTAVLGVAGVWAAGRAERHFGLEDPGPVVIDEVVGMLVTLVFTGVGWRGAVVGFVLFRLFDILKPYPAARLERLGGGLGIMADDVMAAVYANLILQLGMRWRPTWLT
jgi:phosphatidylglycerophosphatase A